MPSSKSVVKFFPMMMAKKVGTTFSNSWNTPPNNFNNLCQKKTQNQTSTVEDELKLGKPVIALNVAWDLPGLRRAATAAEAMALAWEALKREN
jgi:hypothetical protein